MHVSGVVPVEQMAGEDAEDTALLRENLAEARAFLTGQKWCRGIRESHFGCGVGSVVSVFLFRLKPVEGVDEWLWVVVGDLPSAYLVTDVARTPPDALEAYCSLMEDWIDAVRAGKGLSGVYPVDAPPTRDNADALEERIVTIREELLPAFREAL